jgi:hypothetical protein
MEEAVTAKGGKKKKSGGRLEDGVDYKRAGQENVELNGRIATLPKKRRRT